MSYIDEVIKHYIEIEYLGNSLEKDVSKINKKYLDEIMKLLETAKPFVTKGNVSDFQKKARESTESYILRLKALVSKYVEEMLEPEREWFSGLLLGMGVKKPLRSLSFKSLWLIPYTPLFTANSFFADFYRRLISSINTKSQSEMVFGTDRSDTLDSVSNELQKRGKSMVTEAHTILTGASRNIARLSSPEGVKYQYVSILDDRTCLVCASYSGEVYESLSEAPMIPQHERCRCFLMPVTEKQDVDDYSTWLSKQSDSDQREILGKTRYELYKKGMKIGAFVNNGVVKKVSELK